MIRSTPEPGDIGLTTIEGPVGALIRVGQWLDGDGFGFYEHAFVVIDGSRLVEAMPGGARIANLSEYSGHEVVYVAPAGLTDGQRVLIAAAAERLVGVPYSGLDYLALAAHRLHLPMPGLRRYIASTGHLICSQLADQAYQDAGVQLFSDGRWPGFVDPASLYDLLARDDQSKGGAGGDR